MADEAEDVLKELEDYHEKARKKIEKIEQPKEAKKEKPKESIIKEKNPIEIKAEKKVKEEKRQEKKMAEEREITIKIRVNPLVIERIAYITVILILIYFAFFKSISINIGLPSFGTLFGSKGNVSITTPAESETAAADADTTSETAEEEETIETTTTETTTTTATGKIDAELVFDNGNIVVSGTHPSVKVTSITYKIRNKGDYLYSRVDVFWYDENDEPTIKSKVRASHKLGVGTGKVASKTITSFKGTYLSSINKEETFVLKLFDDKTGKKVDEKTVIFTAP